MAIQCRECGGSLASVRKGSVFCCTECRKAWNNRRAVRGAELYDLFMSMRYQRGEATKANTWTVMCNLARAYRDADKHQRNGRRSWDLRETLDRLPIAYSEEGDKR